MNLPDKIEPKHQQNDWGYYEEYLSPEAQVINQLIDYLKEREPISKPGIDDGIYYRESEQK